MLRVTTRLTGGTGGDQWNTVHFGGDTSGEAVAARDAVEDFWVALQAAIDGTYVAHIPADVERVDITTGQVIEEFPVTPFDVDMTASADPLPWMTQGLVRLRTTTFANGRRLQGRIFVPGPNEVQNTSGFPVAGYIANLQTAANALATSGSAAGGLVVYSPTHRVAAAVTTVSVAPYWSVLRSRRQ